MCFDERYMKTEYSLIFSNALLYLFYRLFVITDHRNDQVSIVIDAT